MPPRVNLLEGVSTETKQDAILDALTGLLTELQQKYEGGAIALDPPTLAALESITATVTGSVAVTNLPDEPRADIFNHRITVSPFNQVEMRLDAADWQDFTDQAVTNTGTVTQGSGLVTLATGTHATGSAKLYSTDTVEYRPGVGVYGGGTCVFTAGVTGSTQYAGISSDTAFTNGIAFGYKGTEFGIRYTRGGVEVAFIPQADWDDPCLGAAGSQFSRGGAVEALDPTTYGGPYWIECGLFGFAGWVASVWSPDNGWIPVHTWQNPANGQPVFTSNTFRVLLQATKTSGSTSITMKGQCWAAGAYTDLIRFGDTDRFTDRTLGKPVIASIVGRTTSGGGSYVPVKVNPSGALTTESTVTNLPSTFPLPSSQVQVDALTNAQLRASAINVNDSNAAATLANILTELQQKLEPGGAVKIQVSGVDVTAGNPLPISGTFADENGVPFSGTNPLPVDVGGSITLENLTVGFDSVVSTLNSSTTPLGPNETFTGAWEQVIDYAAVAVTYFSDQWSAVNGAQVQWSTDGTNIDLVEYGTVAPNLGGWSAFPPKARYMRVVFTNGPIAQTVLRSQVIFTFNPVQMPIAPAAAPVHDLTYTVVNKAIVAGKQQSGLYSPITATDAGALDTNDSAAQALLEVLRDAQAPVVPTAAQVASIVTNQALVTPGAGNALRLRKFHMHLDPDATNNNVVTLKIGSTVVFQDEFEPGLPYAETIVVAGNTDEAITVTTTTTSRLYINLRHEEFSP